MRLKETLPISLKTLLTLVLGLAVHNPLPAQEHLETRAFHWERLEQFNGEESQCLFHPELASTVCVEGSTFYVDSSLLPDETHEIKLGGTLGKIVGGVTNPIKSAVEAGASAILGVPSSRFACFEKHLGISIVPGSACAASIALCAGTSGALCEPTAPVCVGSIASISDLTRACD